MTARRPEAVGSCGGATGDETRQGGAVGGGGED